MHRLLDGTNESELFAVYVEKDAFYIEFVATENAADYHLPA